MDTAYWTFSELVLSFICACVPTFRPVMKSFSANIQAFTSKLSFSKTSVGSSTGAASRTSSKTLAVPARLTTFNSKGLARQSTNDAGFEQLEDPKYYEVSAFAKKGSKDGDEDLEMGGIHVVRDMHQTG